MSAIETHEAANIFPMMDAVSYESLKADIAANGQIEPIWLCEGKILDGRNRYRACTELGIDPQFRTYTGDSPVSFVLSINLERRHLTSSQKAAIAVEIEPVLAEEARKRRASTQFGVAVPQIIAEPEKGEARQKAAELTGTNRQYVSDAKKIKEEAPELFVAIQEGEKTIPEAKRELLRASKQAKIEEVKKREVSPPDGKYDVIVIDPPWPMEKIEREVRPNQVKFDYPTMSEDEIKATPMPMAEDCHVWVWTTHKFLPMALRCIEHWGLKYVCTFVWHKPGGPQPFGLPQYNCEFAIYARRGNPLFADTKAFNTAFSAPRGAHSEKPEEFYEVVRRVTAGKRIDIFNRRHIDGFDTWGNESEKLAS